MADYSKQWSMMYDPEFPWDFDIEEIANNMNNDHYYPIICEGFGFIAIGKNGDGKIILAFGDERRPEYIKWKDYEEFMAEEYKKFEEENNDDKIF